MEDKGIRLMEVLETLRNGTRPIEDTPECWMAISDLWETAEEFVRVLSQTFA